MTSMHVKDVAPGDVFLYQASADQPIRAWIRLTEHPDGKIQCESFFSYKVWSDPSKYLYLGKYTPVLV